MAVAPRGAFAPGKYAKMNFPFQIAEPKALLLLLSIPPVVILGIMSSRARPRDRARIQASTVLRALILALVIGAIAGVQWVAAGGPLTVVFLVDESASVSQTNQDAALQYVEKAIASMGPDDRAGVVLFGERAIVARAVSGETDFKPVGNHPAATATNIGEAIQVGTALFPEGGSRRLVLLTDGADTVGQARDQAQLAGQSGVQLSVVPLGGQAQNDAAVDSVTSPDGVPAGQQFDVKVLLKSTSARAASVDLLDNGKPAGHQDVQLKQGDTQITFSVKPTDEGFHVFTARITSVDDRYSENNEASSYTLLQRPPTVLIVTSSAADATPFKQALEASQVKADIVAPEDMPHTDENLLKYDAVVLANASAAAVGVEGQQALQHFVRDLGHGLVMLGGESSYGAGGYLRTPVEEALPVSMDVRTSEERASLAMTFVTDKSGSMGRCHCGGANQFNPSMRTEFGPSKVEIAKLAISKAASVLNSSDKVGVVGFDDTAHWLVDMQQMAGLGNGVLEDDLKPVQAEGGTNLYAGLQAAVDKLSTTDAKLKHVILVSDGWTKQGDFSSILSEMDAQNITLSVVGAGEGAGDLLKTLADKGGGKYYPAQDVNQVPDILLKDTVRMIGSYYVEQPFKPLMTKYSPILKGLDPANLPNLLGYNGSTLKPNAEEIIKSPAGDPILAQWQYGLGRTVAWTPDVKGRWATDWVKWPQFSQFAGQLVGWTLPSDKSPGLQTTFSLAQGAIPEDQQAAVRVESTDASGAPRNFLSTNVTITSTTGYKDSASALQQSPGVYGTQLKGLKQGVYQVRVDQTEPETGKAVASQVTGLVVPYPSEYRLSAGAEQASLALLSDLQQLGGGKTLDIARPETAFTHDIASQPRPVALWPWFLALAIILFPIDVAVRRLTVSWRDLRVAGRLMKKKA